MLVSRFYHDDLGVMPAFHMLGLRESLRSYCFRMMQDFVVHLVFLQTIDQSFWDFHTRLRGKKYHFPRLSLVPGQSRWNAPFRIFAHSALSRLLKAGGALRIPRRKRVANTCNNARILECSAAAPLSIYAVQLCERD